MAKEKEKIVALIFAFFLLGGTAHAETYGPLTFSLPTGWQCTIQKSSDVCLDKNASKPNGVLVVTFKNRTPEDTLVYYQNQLSAPRPLKTGEVITPSQVKLIRQITLNGQQWIEAVHHNSEILGYYTHYLVTVADPYAVLVSITVSDQDYAELMTNLGPTINSMKVAVQQPATAQNSPPQTVSAPQAPVQDVTPAPARHKSKMLLYLGVGLAVALFLLVYAIVQ